VRSKQNHGNYGHDEHGADLGDRAYAAMALATASGGIFVLLARGWVTQSKR
jgi:hypothetical protein